MSPQPLRNDKDFSKTDIECLIKRGEKVCDDLKTTLEAENELIVAYKKLLDFMNENYG